MSRFLLDTSALLALRNNEPGAQRVNDLLLASASGTATVYVCFMSLMEVLYRVWKDEGENAGRLAYAQCQTLPMTWLRESPAPLESAAGFKACHLLSLADAWIAATALQCDATLVHKDPEFQSIRALIEQEKLPYR